MIWGGLRNSSRPIYFFVIIWYNQDTNNYRVNTPLDLKKRLKMIICFEMLHVKKCFSEMTLRHTGAFIFA